MSRIRAFDALTLLLPLWPRGADKAARESAKERMRKAWQPDAYVIARDDIFCAGYIPTLQCLATDTEATAPDTLLRSLCNIHQLSTMGCSIALSRRLRLTPKTTRTIATAPYLRRHDRANAGSGQHRHLPPGWSDALRHRRRKPPRRLQLHYGDATPSSDTTPCEL
jgi:hypothetical protein